MTDPPTPTDEVEVPAADAATDPTAALSYHDLLASLGFDPGAVRAVVVTASSTVAISDDYPEPYTLTEATHGE